MSDILEAMMTPNVETYSGLNAIIRNDIQCNKSPMEQKRIEASQCDAIIDSRCIKNTGVTSTSLCGAPSETYCEADFSYLYSSKTGKYERNVTEVFPLIHGIFTMSSWFF